jgi:hypothetical protein
LGVSGSRIGRENALHTMEISFSNGRKLQVEIYHKALDNSHDQYSTCQTSHRKRRGK